MTTEFKAGDAVVARYNAREHAGVIVSGPRMVGCRQAPSLPAIPKYWVTFTVKSTGAVKTREIWGAWIKPAQEAR